MNLQNIELCERSHLEKATYLKFTLYKMSIIGKSIETGAGRVEGNRQWLLLMVMRFLFGVKNVVELDTYGGCTSPTLNVLKTSELHTWKRWILLYVDYIVIFKITNKWGVITLKTSTYNSDGVIHSDQCPNKYMQKSWMYVFYRIYRSNI